MTEPIQCVILAGGLAERMRPLTERVPKSLLPIAGHPFVHYQLQWLASHGVTEAVLCIGHLGELIRDYVGDGYRWGIRVTYVEEGQQLRGTGGAIRLASEQGSLREVFLLTYGDSFLPIDFRQVWDAFRRQPAPALMTVFRNHGRWDTSNACFEDGWITLYDKSRTARQSSPFEFIDYGLSAMRREIVEKYIPPACRFDLAVLFNQLSVEGNLAGYEIHERFYEIGSLEGLDHFARFLDAGGLQTGR